MQVRPGRSAGRADIPNYLPLRDRLSHRQPFREGIEMHVLRFHAFAVVELDQIARAARHGAKGDRRIAGCVDRGSGRRSEVHAAMFLLHLGNRVRAVSEFGCDPRPVDRGLHQPAHVARSGFVVPLRIAIVGRDERIIAARLGRRRKRYSEELRSAEHPAGIGHALFVGGGKFRADPDFRLEVVVERENLGEFADETVRHPRGNRRNVECVVLDRAANRAYLRRSAFDHPLAVVFAGLVAHQLGDGSII